MIISLTFNKDLAVTWDANSAGTQKQHLLWRNQGPEV
jgi:hypothetical protein